MTRYDNLSDRQKDAFGKVLLRLSNMAMEPSSDRYGLLALKRASASQLSTSDLGKFDV